MSLAIDIDWQRPQPAGKRFHLQLDCRLEVVGTTAIYGPSGSGKTTLLRVLAGLEKVAQARVELAGEIWQNARRFVPTHQRQLGYVFQQPSLFKHLNVNQNILYGLRRRSSQTPSVELDDLLNLLGLEQLLKRFPEQLSGGEQQRVALARCLITQPRLLLLDEPLAALDEARKKEILAYLKKLQQHYPTPMIYVSHSHYEVAQLADWVMLMEAGRMTAIDRPQALFADLSVDLGQASSLVEGQVRDYDQTFHLMTVGVAESCLQLISQPQPLGSRVRIQILAKDVSISLVRPEGSSIQNIVAVKIVQIKALGSAHMLLKLDSNGLIMVSEITRKSFTQLDLSVGQMVYAQIKAVSLLH